MRPGRKARNPAAEAAAARLAAVLAEERPRLCRYGHGCSDADWCAVNGCRQPVGIKLSEPMV